MLHLGLALVLSVATGLSLGLLGGGGSILALPVLVYVAGIAPASAVAMSLAIVGTTSLLSALAHRRDGHVDLRVAAVFGAAGMIGAFAGAQLTSMVSEPVLMLAFAGLMLVVGIAMLSGAGDRLAERRAAHSRPWLTALVGASIGALTGFLGVGGGFLVVPALVLLTGMPMKRAIGTSLVVIAINSAAGLLAHLGEGALDVPRTAAFTAAALVGALAGQRLAARWPAARLRRAFAGFVTIVGAAVAIQAVLAL